MRLARIGSIVGLCALLCLSACEDNNNNGCPGGTAFNLLMGAPEDPMWSDPGESNPQTVCIHGGIGLIYFTLPDKTSVNIQLACDNKGTCAAGEHKCLESGEAGENDVYATITTLDSGYNAGAYGSGMPNPGSSCTYNVAIDGDTLNGHFDGTLGYYANPDPEFMRLRFDFTIKLTPNN